MVSIHGGGYGQGYAGYVTYGPLLTTPGNEPFIGVAIQYRLGAFGFLSSSDVKQAGVLNAGLLDQQFALQWVQKYIHLFGGDKTKVTIYGTSAGAGSVMLHAMAYGGSQGVSLFRYGIASSPYIPKQYQYNEDFPTAKYNQFVKAAGCDSVSGNKLPCLRNVSAQVLSTANFNINAAGIAGTWTYLPVTDFSLVQYAPTAQLLQSNYSLNGERIWSGNNADEGAIFIPQNITTFNDLRSFIQTYLPRFSANDIMAVMAKYPQTVYGMNANNPKFATTGTGSGMTPSALDVSPVSIGNQQLANLIYGEFTFICPSYWLATGFSRSYRTAYKYQYSIPFAFHNADVTAYFGPPVPNQGDDFSYAWRRMYGHYIATGTPNVANVIGNGISTGNTAPNVLSNWPVWSDGQPQTNPQVDFNQTGGTPYIATDGAFMPTQLRQPGLKNDFKSVDAIGWEAGRGARCDFWRSMAAKVPY